MNLDILFYPDYITCLNSKDFFFMNLLTKLVHNEYDTKLLFKKGEEKQVP